MRRYTVDAQSAFGFLVSQVSVIEPQVYAIRYPDIQYPLLVPVDTSAPEWAKSITFFSSDRVGAADWFHHMAKDIPLADVERSKFEQGIEMAGIGYRYTLEELGQAMMIPNLNITIDRAAAARRAYEEFVDLKVISGDTQKGWTGLINSDDIVTVITVVDEWPNKTGDQILLDINNMLSGIYVDSATVEMADTLLLPIASFNYIATTRMGTSGDTRTILEQLMVANVYTAQTGQRLTVRAIRGLETAGVGGVGRAVAYRRDPQVLKLHLPMPHRFLPVWQTGPITYDVPGIFRLGGLEIRLPKAIRYLDGVLDTLTST